tara:strand:- start:308 stop:460 length:153 start_codon:yes stop_codon:yes gene_type:complete
LTKEKELEKFLLIKSLKLLIKGEVLPLRQYSIKQPLLFTTGLRDDDIFGH